MYILVTIRSIEQQIVRYKFKKIMKNKTDAELLAQIEMFSGSEYYGGQELAAMLPEVLTRSAEVRSALANAWDSRISEVHMDVCCHKFPLEEGYDMIIAAYAGCSQLCPDDKDFAYMHATVLIERAEEISTDKMMALGDLNLAMTILEKIQVSNQANAQVLYALGSAYARFACLTGAQSGVEAAHLSHQKFMDAFNTECGPMYETDAIWPNNLYLSYERILGTWWYAIETFCQHDDPPIRQYGEAAKNKFNEFANQQMTKDPFVSALWGLHFTRFALRGKEPPVLEILDRAAKIWKAYALDMRLSSEQAGTIAHSIVECAAALQDRELYLSGLQFHDYALQLDAKNGVSMVSYRTGYVANICIAIAELADTDEDSAWEWYERGISAFRQHSEYFSDFQCGHNYAELLVKRAQRFALSPEHPDLDEAWSCISAFMAEYGKSYFIPYEIAARARLLQGRENEALSILIQGVIRLTPFVDVQQIVRESWFTLLSQTRQDFLQQGLMADLVSQERVRIAQELGYRDFVAQ
ncbi:MAG: hypothetical protein K2X63_00655 [Burkholderiaceae bacterium]|nr:hypothetical protein [Burkholderiaceae bacterium]